MLHDVRLCIRVYPPCTSAAAALHCVAILLLQQLLLLAAAVRQYVPDGKHFLPWFIASDSIVVFLFIQTRLIFTVPLGSTVSHLQLRLLTYCLTHIT